MEDPEVVEGLGEAGLQLQRLLVERVGLVGLAVLEERKAEVVERVGEFGPGLESGAEALDRAGHVAALRE